MRAKFFGAILLSLMAAVCGYLVVSRWVEVHAHSGTPYGPLFYLAALGFCLFTGLALKVFWSNARYWSLLIVLPMEGLFLVGMRLVLN
ncbi:MAG TPA: hypothetical protein VJ835_03225 [Fimbriimonadaceae bacterium]|nr:hypothetical protein [Fimbriimonadaceae bacterium]